MLVTLQAQCAAMYYGECLTRAPGRLLQYNEEGYCRGIFPKDVFYHQNDLSCRVLKSDCTVHCLKLC